MKNFILFILFALTIASCSNNNLDNEARAELKNFDFGNEIKPSTIKIEDVKTMFSNDSLCILKCFITGERHDGDSIKYEIEYIYIRLSDSFKSGTKTEDNEAYINLTLGEKSIFSETDEHIEIAKWAKSKNSSSNSNKSDEELKADMLYYSAIASISKFNAKKTAIEDVREKVTDPKSFKTKKIEVVIDTVPLYLNYDLLNLAEKFYEKAKEVDYYDKLGDYYYDEARSAYNEGTSLLKSLKKLYQEKLGKDRPVEYIVLIEFSAKNAYGAEVPMRCISIVDRDNLNNVLGYYFLDHDQLDKIFVIFHNLMDWGPIKQNEFGKIDTDGMSIIEQFIFGI